MNFPNSRVDYMCYSSFTWWASLPYRSFRIMISCAHLKVWWADSPVFSFSFFTFRCYWEELFGVQGRETIWKSLDLSGNKFRCMNSAEFNGSPIFTVELCHHVSRGVLAGPKGNTILSWCVGWSAIAGATHHGLIVGVDLFPRNQGRAERQMRHHLVLYPLVF